MENKKIDILCIGEALVDFIGHQPDVSLSLTKDYHRYIGGSPTNVAMNMARLGLNATLIATIGKDGLGDYILERLNEVQVNTALIRKDESKPTSSIFISRTSGTPEFIPYLSADSEIIDAQIPDHILEQAKLFHTTSFSLSRNPAQKTILNAAKKVLRFNCKLSIDVNYSEKIWPDRNEAIKVLGKYFSKNPLVKISQDDISRLFGVTITIEEALQKIHDYGVDLICLTLGKDGVIVSQNGQPTIIKPAKEIKEVKDATGAGDAFWSGFLFSYIKNFSLSKSLDVAQSLSALKLQHVGRLPNNINILSSLLH